MSDENEERELSGESGGNHEPKGAGAICFAGSPFGLGDQPARSVARRSAGDRLCGAIGKLAEICGALLDEE